MNEVATFAANYGLAGLFAVMFWRFIKTTQKDQNETLQSLANSVEKLADKVDNNG